MTSSLLALLSYPGQRWPDWMSGSWLCSDDPAFNRNMPFSPLQETLKIPPSAAGGPSCQYKLQHFSCMTKTFHSLDSVNDFYIIFATRSRFSHCSGARHTEQRSVNDFISDEPLLTDDLPGGKRVRTTGTSTEAHEAAERPTERLQIAPGSETGRRYSRSRTTLLAHVHPSVLSPLSYTHTMRYCIVFILFTE
ncbi:Uncharacterized protein DAT39_000029 [Clarias magur]|uniref:Uncharacterized protein n=1 Tax=Clarias magur TaxID=1594786 RepID=A0A8J4XH81_CLAMG|nr:Uncharacterized protein DAT39_000029 [Clarias magur]